jgi:hypothetical protein
MNTSIRNVTAIPELHHLEELLLWLSWADKIIPNIKAGGISGEKCFWVMGSPIPL